MFNSAFSLTVILHPANVVKLSTVSLALSDTYSDPAMLLDFVLILSHYLLNINFLLIFISAFLEM